VAQSVACLTLGLGADHDLRVLGSNPESDSVLSLRFSLPLPLQSINQSIKQNLLKNLTEISVLRTVLGAGERAVSKTDKELYLIKTVGLDRCKSLLPTSNT